MRTYIKPGWSDTLIPAFLFLAVLLIFQPGCSDDDTYIVGPVESGHENLDHHRGCPNQSGRCHFLTDSTDSQFIHHFHDSPVGE